MFTAAFLAPGSGKISKCTCGMSGQCFPVWNQDPCGTVVVRPRCGTRRDSLPFPHSRHPGTCERRRGLRRLSSDARSRCFHRPHGHVFRRPRDARADSPLRVPTPKGRTRCEGCEGFQPLPPTSCSSCLSLPSVACRKRHVRFIRRDRGGPASCGERGLAVTPQCRSGPGMPNTACSVARPIPSTASRLGWRWFRGGVLACVFWSGGRRPALRQRRHPDPRPGRRDPTRRGPAPAWLAVGPKLCSATSTTTPIRTGTRCASAGPFQSSPTRGHRAYKGIGKLRYVVEQNPALPHHVKRLAVRWERRTELRYVSLCRLQPHPLPMPLEGPHMIVL